MERREQTRGVFEIPVLVNRGTTRERCSSRDISTGGMRIEAGGGTPFEHGETFVAAFELPGREEPTRVGVIVRWVANGGRSCGVQFTTRLDPGETRTILRLVSPAAPAVSA